MKSSCNIYTAVLTKKHQNAVKICWGTKPIYLKLEWSTQETGGLVMTRGFANELQLIPAQFGPKSIQLSEKLSSQSELVQILLHPVSPLWCLQLGSITPKNPPQEALRGKPSLTLFHPRGGSDTGSPICYEWNFNPGEHIFYKTWQNGV